MCSCRLRLAPVTVTVTIAQISGSNWQIQLTDDTNAQAFTRDESYTAPLSLVEWVVEAPEDRSVCGGACDLSPYSPAVTFSGAGCTGGVSQLYDYTMIQGGVDVATPSAVPGWPSVFSIGYSSGGTNSRIARAPGPPRRGPASSATSSSRAEVPTLLGRHRASRSRPMWTSMTSWRCR